MLKEECLKRGSMKRDKDSDARGLGWRVGLSIIVAIGWVVFIILWLFFYAIGYNIYQNIAVAIASLLIGAAILGASWASWGIKQREWCCNKKKER